MQHYHQAQATKVNSASSSVARFGIKPSKPIISLLLVEAHPLLSRGIRDSLEATHEFEVVGEAQDWPDALGLAEELLPEVVLIDLQLSGNRALELCRTIKRRLPEIACMVLSLQEEEGQFLEALQAGASAYISKEITPDQLAESVRQVAAGNYPINDSILGRPKVANLLLHQFQALQRLEEDEVVSSRNRGAQTKLFSSLSEREIEVLSSIARGNSNKQVARELCISDQTVKNHISSILKKLNANDRTQAVMIALKQGWIKLEAEEAA
jgi:DNA-binding NarL/FixJ family response regulator